MTIVVNRFNRRGFLKVVSAGVGGLIVGSVTGSTFTAQPEAAQYANAYSYEHIDRQYGVFPPLADAEAEAKNRAVLTGADPSTVEIVDVEEIAMPYLPGNAVRVRVKAVGKLKS